MVVAVAVVRAGVTMFGNGGGRAHNLFVNKVNKH